MEFSVSQVTGLGIVVLHACNYVQPQWKTLFKNYTCYTIMDVAGNCTDHGYVFSLVCIR
jgi:hypothetical protein